MSSPAAPTSGLSNDAFALRELIGKLGGIGNSTTFPPSATTTAAASPFPGTNTNSSTNDSSYRTPLSSPKLHLPILDQINMPNLGKSVPLTPPLPSFSGDPGFAERAAKFSCFGSRSFNGRTSPFGVNNAELGRRSSTPLMGDVKLSRVSSSPSLKQDGSPLENKNLSQQQMEMRPVNGMVLGSDKKLSKLSGSGANSNEDSSVSEQIPSGETGSKTSNELNSRKRKAISRGKPKDDRSTSAKVCKFCAICANFLYIDVVKNALNSRKFFVSRELKGMMMEMQSAQSQQKVAKMRPKLRMKQKEYLMMKVRNKKLIKSLQNHQRTTFMSEQEGAKPLTAIV